MWSMDLCWQWHCCDQWHHDTAVTISSVWSGLLAPWHQSIGHPPTLQCEHPAHHHWLCLYCCHIPCHALKTHNRFPHHCLCFQDYLLCITPTNIFSSPLASAFLSMNIIQTDLLSILSNILWIFWLSIMKMWGLQLETIVYNMVTYLHPQWDTPCILVSSCCFDGIAIRKPLFCWSHNELIENIRRVWRWDDISRRHIWPLSLC